MPPIPDPTPAPRRVVFRWDYLGRFLVAAVLLGAVRITLEFTEFERAYRAIGLAGFLEVALGVVVVGLVAVCLNYAWCLAAVGLQARFPAGVWHAAGHFVGRRFRRSA